MGMATNMRNDMSNAILTGEKARSLFSQERIYALDRALLLAGITSGDGCGSMETAESFPYIPTVPEGSSLYEYAFEGTSIIECPENYDAVGPNGDYCCPAGYDYVNVGEEQYCCYGYNIDPETEGIICDSRKPYKDKITTVVCDYGYEESNGMKW